MSDMLKDQVALVTGGARGIGKSIGEALAAVPRSSWPTSTEEGAKESAAELTNKYGVTAEGLACDVSKAEECQPRHRNRQKNTANSISSSTTPASLATNCSPA